MIFHRLVQSSNSLMRHRYSCSWSAALQTLLAWEQIHEFEWLHYSVQSSHIYILPTLRPHMFHIPPQAFWWILTSFQNKARTPKRIQRIRFGRAIPLKISRHNRQNINYSSNWKDQRDYLCQHQVSSFLPDNFRLAITFDSKWVSWLVLPPF